MHRPDFNELELQLLNSGLAPRQVRRTVAELSDHFDDLVESAVLDGAERRSAEVEATERLGKFDDISNEVRARPELRGWAYRHPWLALVVYPITCLALLPAMPVLAGVAHASHLAKWTACIVLSGLVTAAMLLILQLSIALG